MVKKVERTTVGATPHTANAAASTSMTRNAERIGPIAKKALKMATNPTGHLTSTRVSKK